MRKCKLFSLLRHSLQMVLRTWKSYALLSVTIVLSFSLLLGYMTFSDSAIYNDSKELFSYRRQDIRIQIRTQNADALPLLVDGLSDMENTGYYVTYIYNLGFLDADYVFERNGELHKLKSSRITGYLLPDHSWPEDVNDYLGNPGRWDIVWLDGQEHKEFTLEKDQVILPEALYQMLQMDRQENPVFLLNILYGQKIPLRVAGYYKNFTYEMWEAGRKTSASWADERLLHLILSNKFIDYAQLNNEDLYGKEYDTSYDVRLDNVYMQIYSETPEKVLGLIKSAGIQNYSSIYELQNAALDEIRPQKQVKAIITCALLLLLGINLYSSFTNAMNDRKYEIGVKRAVGASAFSIVRQFLYESVIVMAANILASIALVADVAIIYKYIVEHTPDEFGVYPDYILYISPYSAAMFSICAVSLTVVFSLIFAYKSTRVEIVQYLKAE